MPNLQELDIYANEINLDPVKNINQRIGLTTEGFRDGILRLGTLDAQTWNQMMFLLSSYAAPHPCCPQLVPSGEPLPSVALEMDGFTTVNAVDNPNLFEVWGSPLPNLSASAPAGTKYIVRNS